MWNDSSSIKSCKEIDQPHITTFSRCETIDVIASSHGHNTFIEAKNMIVLPWYCLEITTKPDAGNQLYNSFRERQNDAFEQKSSLFYSWKPSWNNKNSNKSVPAILLLVATQLNQQLWAIWKSFLREIISISRIWAKKQQQEPRKSHSNTGTFQRR